MVCLNPDQSFRSIRPPQAHKGDSKTSEWLPTNTQPATLQSASLKTPQHQRNPSISALRSGNLSRLYKSMRAAAAMEKRLTSGTFKTALPHMPVAVDLGAPELFDKPWYMLRTSTDTSSTTILVKLPLIMHDSNFAAVVKHHIDPASGAVAISTFRGGIKPLELAFALRN